MRIRSWLVSAAVTLMSMNAEAQIGPGEAYPIYTASPDPPLMHFDQKDRQTEVEITVGADGHTIGTKLLKRSGSGVYDERVRGFWKDQPFVPAIDANGRPRQTTLIGRNTYSFKPMQRGIENRKRGEGSHFKAEILDQSPDVMANRIQRMTCHDMLWEYEFMRALAPRAKLRHEEIFHVAFAMLIAAKHLGNDARDALIAQWDPLIDQTLDSCRAQPGAQYWRDAFAHVFESAAPVGINVQ